MHVLKFKVRIKVVVQSPLALVPQLHVLSHSQTGEQWIYSSGRQIPSCTFGSLSPLLPQKQRWWFILVCELIRKACVADQSKINISCWNVTLCSLASVPLGGLEKRGGASSCGGLGSQSWDSSRILQHSNNAQPISPNDERDRECLGNLAASETGVWPHVLGLWGGERISVPNCSLCEKGAERPRIRHF